MWGFYDLSSMLRLLIIIGMNLQEMISLNSCYVFDTVLLKIVYSNELFFNFV